MEPKYQIKFVVVYYNHQTVENLLSFDDPQIAMDVCQQYKGNRKYHFTEDEAGYRVEVQFA